MSRFRIKGVAAAFLLALALLGAATAAQANRVHYSGYVGDRVLVGFYLVGKNCPNGRRCYKPAKVKRFQAWSYDWPDCPSLLRSGFVFADPETNTPEPVKVNKRRHFHAVGGSTEDLYDVVVIDGKISKNGRRAHGTFRVIRAGFGTRCTTGKVPWSIPRRRR